MSNNIAELVGTINDALELNGLITTVFNVDSIKTINGESIIGTGNIDTIERETTLPNASGIGSGDYLRTVNSNNESEKINYTLLAQAIIEQFTGSTLAGSSQSVKSAVNMLYNRAKWNTYNQTTREDLLAKIDSDLSKIGQGEYLGFMLSAQAVLLGLDSGNSYYVIGKSNSVNFRQLHFIRADGTAEYNLSKQSGTWGSSPIKMPTRAEVSALNNTVSSATGGVPIRQAGNVTSGNSFTVEFSNTYSQNEGFALVALNQGGNALAGVELLFLGRGTSKIKPILGTMSTDNYTASYSGSTWTITSNVAQLFYTVILSK